MLATHFGKHIEILNTIFHHYHVRKYFQAVNIGRELVVRIHLHKRVLWYFSIIIKYINGWKLSDVNVFQTIINSENSSTVSNSI